MSPERNRAMPRRWSPRPSSWATALGVTLLLAPIPGQAAEVTLPGGLAWVLGLHLLPLAHLVSSRAWSPCYRTSYGFLYVMVTAIAWTLSLVLGHLAPAKPYLWAPLALPLVLWAGLVFRGTHRDAGPGASCPRR